MQPHNTYGLIRIGILALPLSGILALVGLYSTFKLGSGGILATGDCQPAHVSLWLRPDTSVKSEQAD